MREFLRLNITAEGQTEERFIKDALSEYLGQFQITTDVRRVRTSKDKHKTYRGGLISYEKAKFDIKTWLREDNNTEARFTTMFDLYALPQDFPGYDEATSITDIYKKVEYLESKFKEDIDDYRFFPYIQLHEFEALVLAKPDNLSLEYFDHDAAISKLNDVLKSKDYNPEAINENKETAPSKRIIKLIPEYDKVNVGAFVAELNGISFLKEKCKHFGSWIDSLEKLK